MNQQIRAAEITADPPRPAAKNRPGKPNPRHGSASPDLGRWCGNNAAAQPVPVVRELSTGRELVRASCHRHGRERGRRHERK